MRTTLDLNDDLLAEAKAFAARDKLSRALPLCHEHRLIGNAIRDGWIAAAGLARCEGLATFDRDFIKLLPSRQLLLLPS